jgi:transcriptional regulator with XRE-family HTH domain
MLRRRLALKLLQRQVADQIGVNKASIANWEINRSKPAIGYIPGIIRFLGYVPLPPTTGWPDRLLRCRKVLGISQFEAARRMGVDQCTLARWERGEREPNGKYARRAAILLKTVEPTSADIAKSA